MCQGLDEKKPPLSSAAASCWPLRLPWRCPSTPCATAQPQHLPLAPCPSYARAQDWNANTLTRNSPSPYPRWKQMQCVAAGGNQEDGNVSATQSNAIAAKRESQLAITALAEYEPSARRLREQFEESAIVCVCVCCHLLHSAAYSVCCCCISLRCARVREFVHMPRVGTVLIQAIQEQYENMRLEIHDDGTVVVETSTCAPPRREATAQQ
eukprot:2748786-Amphidinium_carterae.2